MKARNSIYFLIILTITVFSGHILTAQYHGTMERQVKGYEFFSPLDGKLSIGTVQLNPSDIEGSMYFDENFANGIVYKDGEPIAKVLMRYNAYTDEIEIKRDSKSAPEGLMKAPSVSCEFNNEKMVFTEFTNKKGDKKEGYLAQYVESESFQLYENKKMIFKEGQKAKTSLHLPQPDKFVDRSVLYISRNSESPVFLQSSKGWMADYLGAEKEVKSYIKQNKLDLSDKEDLKTLILYANSLKKEEDTKSLNK